MRTRYIELMSGNLETVDPEVKKIIKDEALRMKSTINLIASENYTSRAGLQAFGSLFCNKYAEGYPDDRDYAGNNYTNQLERLAQKRALKLYGLDPEEWGVNLQALSGAPANLYVFWAINETNTRILGPSLSAGGHPSHGFFTSNEKFSATSDYFSTYFYLRNEKTRKFDREEIDFMMERTMPHVLVAGYSLYTDHYDYGEMKRVANKHGAYLMADMAHISGLVAAKVAPNLFEHCDIVTTTTHKSLQCSRGAMTFYRKGVRSTTKKGDKIYYDLENKINDSVYPAHQSGPHINNIAGIAVGLELANTPEFIDYQT